MFKTSSLSNRRVYYSFMSIIKWDSRFLSLAKLVSTWSKDPSTQVGAAIVDIHKRIVSVGYNGLPSRIPDKEEYYSNRDLKYKMIVHGEINAILFSNRDLTDCTLYTYPFLPCSVCASIIIQSNICRVVAPKPSLDIEKRWGESLKLTKNSFNMAGVKWLEIDEKSII